MNYINLDKSSQLLFYLADKNFPKFHNFISVFATPIAILIIVHGVKSLAVILAYVDEITPRCNVTETKIVRNVTASESPIIICRKKKRKQL